MLSKWCVGNGAELIKCRAHPDSGRARRKFRRENGATFERMENDIHSDVIRRFARCSLHVSMVIVIVVVVVVVVVLVEWAALDTSQPADHLYAARHQTLPRADNKLSG